jgi:hypothetical protein
LAVDIPVKHLFVEYKFWIERKTPFATVREEVATLARQGDNFRRILEPRKNDLLFGLVTFLDCFDISTAYSLLLNLMEQNLGDAAWIEIAKALESYLVRRAVCGMTTKNYNRVFLTLTRQVQGQGAPAETVSKYLSELKGESTEWPSDHAFRSAWTTRDAYRLLQNQKLVHLLKRINDAYFSSKSERISIEGPLSIEHILPQNWTVNWLLPDGSKGMSEDELQDSQPGDARAEATLRRISVLQTMGNLTILTQELNSSVSNSAWATKKPALLAASLLPINQKLQAVEHWDESCITRRSEDLFDVAVKVWREPPART